MDKATLTWACFVSILCPLFLRTPTDPMFLTALQISGCLAAVAFADRLEHRGH